jgi:SSS family solute:Na+ symporter
VTPHLVLLTVFVALQIAVGLWIARRVRSASDFFVAGRGLPAPLVFATFLAANIGAGSTVGAASLGYRLGLGAWWWNASAGIGSLVLALWVGPRLWRLAKDHGFLTFGDFLEWRYGPRARGAASALLWCISLAILAGQLLGASSILQVVLGLPRWVGAFVGGLVVVTYFVAGGLLSSAWVNLVQLTVKLTGFLLAVVMTLSMTGGWAGLTATTGLPSTFGQFTGPSHVWLQYVVLLVPAFIVSPGLVQKAYGAESARAVRIGVGLNGLGLIVFAIAPVVLGMAARARHPGLTDVNLALPTLLAVDLPPFVGALTMAAVLSAEISAADAVLFMLSTSFSQDLYRRFLVPDASDVMVVTVARRAAVVAGVIGVALALVIPTVVDALKIFYGLLTVALFVPVMAAMASTRGGEPEALASMAAGVLMWGAVRLSSGATGPAGMPPETLGLMAAALAFGATLIVRRPA